MLISRVLEDESAKKRINAEDHSHEGQAVYDVLETKPRVQSFDANADADSLTPEDLVVLYKNIDKGTKLKPDADQCVRQKANQYVETIVYNDDQESDGSDVSDVYSAEESQKVFLFNKERIDFLNSNLSLENNLCQKFGGVDIQSRSLTPDYSKNFLFQDHYIKGQLNSLSVGFNQLEGSLLPASLLDYICCKRLEDNYNFYMDNIITYVKHTIEQLKRISNGEYLTDRTKQKWKEVGNANINKSTKILATSTSIPLYVASKSSGQASTWNDLVHSEIDIRYLSKILEKQIIIEVPKLICGSYKLFSKRCADNLIISCKKDKPDAIEYNKDEENKSRVDLVFRLQKSQSGHMMGNINSIMIVQRTPANIIENDAQALLPLTYKDTESIEGTDEIIKITEISKGEEDNTNTVVSTTDNTAESKNTYFGDYETQCDSVVGTNDYPYSDIDYNIFKNQSGSELSESTKIFKKSLNNEPSIQSESTCYIASSNDLTSTVKKLNKEICFSEENGQDFSIWTNTINKKKSPTRIRIKSPYENRSHILEEKKRKRLLEIRERREKKKLALDERYKISKHKYPNSAVTPHPSSSVTKLSITNKSFYDSIYGQAQIIESKQGKLKCHIGIKKDSIPEAPLDEIKIEGDSPSFSYGKNSEKDINNSDYLDNAVTEVMYMEIKDKDNWRQVEECSTSTSMVSSDFRDNMKILPQIIRPSVKDLHNENVTSDDTFTNEIPIVDEKNNLQTVETVYTLLSLENIVPANSPTQIASVNKSDIKKATSSLECRKSIDKIYTLMNKLNKNKIDELVSPKNKSLLPLDAIEDQGSSTVQGSDSGTSVKHHLTSSNPSYFSFGKTNEVKYKIANGKKLQTPIIPKVIISTKCQSLKSDIDKTKKNKKVLINAPKPVDDPLRAISQLLHNIDNVQKTRHKTTEPKVSKKSEPMPSDVKNSPHNINVKRRSRFDQYLKNSQFKEKDSTVIVPRKTKPNLDMSKLQQQPSINEKDKINQRIIVDIIDEAKEARGEAVRGPPKYYSRLNSLAQPKKSYVQAHSEEYQTKYGRNLLADRLQKLATTAPNFLERKVGSANTRIKPKKTGTEAMSSVSVKAAPVPTIAASVRRTASNSPKEKSLPVIPPSKFNKKPQTSEPSSKMTHIETYVKGQYEHASLVSELEENHISRIPLVPTDIDLISDTSINTSEESNELGNNLHQIIDTMVNTNYSNPDGLSEGVGTLSMFKITEELYPVDSLSKGDEPISKEFHFSGGVFEHKNIFTAVVKDKGKEIKEIDKGANNFIQPQARNFTTEMAKSENALWRHIPIGTFQKRLRIKNLTLTSKQSVKYPFLLQSGDTASIFLRNSLSQNFSTCDYDKFSGIKRFPTISRSDLDWSFVQFPVQFAAVGYAFPKFSILKLFPTPKLKSLGEEVKEDSKTTNIQDVDYIECNKTARCSDIEQPKVKNENAVQVHSTEISATATHKPRHNVTKENKGANVENVIEPVSEVKDEVVQLVCDRDIKCSEKINDMPSVDYTASLDILVSLLNEIQNITTCNTRITNSNCNEGQCEGFKTVTNETAAPGKDFNDDSRNIVSITSVDNLRQLGSSASIFSLYLTSSEEHDSCGKTLIAKNIHTPVHEDKQVYANFHEHETVNRFTDIPSIFPITINHSTNVTNSLIGVLSEPSSQSLFSSYVEYESLYSDNSINSQILIKELPRPKPCGKSSEQPLVPYENKIILDRSMGLNVLSRKVGCKNDHFDPSVKMKRDILVTVYSILVFTVFAALSFPEMMYGF